MESQFSRGKRQQLESQVLSSSCLFAFSGFSSCMSIKQEEKIKGEHQGLQL